LSAVDDDGFRIRPFGMRKSARKYLAQGCDVVVQRFASTTPDAEGAVILFDRNARIEHGHHADRVRAGDMRGVIGLDTRALLILAAILLDERDILDMVEREELSADFCGLLEPLILRR